MTNTAVFWLKALFTTTLIFLLPAGLAKIGSISILVLKLQKLESAFWQWRIVISVLAGCYSL